MSHYPDLMGVFPIEARLAEHRRREEAEQDAGSAIQAERMAKKRAVYDRHKITRESTGPGPMDTKFMSCSCGWYSASIGNYQHDQLTTLDGEQARHWATVEAEAAA